MNSTRLHDFRIDDWLPPGVSLENLIVALAALAVMLTVFAIVNALRGDSTFHRRLEEISARRERLRRKALASTSRRQRPSPAGLMREAVTRLNLLRSQQATQARDMLARAGFRSQDAMVVYLFAQFTLPFLFGLAAVVSTDMLQIVPVSERYNLMIVVGAVAAGFYAPRVYLKNITTRRAQQLQRALPDSLDLMVICAEAGLSLDAILVRVGKEVGNSWPEFSEELGITAAELTFLPDRRQAFDNLATRTGSDGVRAIVTTLQQAAKFGTPLAKSLRVLAAEFRDQRMMKAEEKAARLPALLTVPMMIFILPTLFIVLLGPAILGVLDVMAGRSPANAHPAVNTGVAGHAGGAAAGGPAADGAGGGGGADEPIGDAAAAGGGAAGQQMPMAGGDAAAGGPAHGWLSPSPGGGPALPSASLTLIRSQVRFIDPITVDVDAKALASGSKLLLAVVPEGTPDRVADPAALERDGTAIVPAQLRVSLPPTTVGKDEVRLYYIPQFSSVFSVVARAPVEVTPGRPDAASAGLLLHEAAALGATPFADKYAGRTMTIEGQFLGLRRLSAEEVGAAPLLHLAAADAGNSYSAVAIGWSDAEPPLDGSPNQMLCLIPNGDGAALRRIAALSPGDAVLVRGTPGNWSSVGGMTAVVIRGCSLPN